MAEPSGERIEWTGAPDLPGADLLLVDRTAHRWVVFHETYTLCTCTDFAGTESEWTYRGRTYRGRTGGVMLLEPGELHANTRRTSPVTFRVLLIQPSLVYRAAEELAMTSKRPQWRSGYTDNPIIFQRLAALHTSLESAATGLERESRFVACLRLLLEQCTDTGAPAAGAVEPARLLRARDYIVENCSRAVTLEELAGVADLSRFHLVRAFAKRFGVPPHAYQLRVQLAHAKALLGLGKTPARVAADSGFADQSHLTRHFRQVYGVTPALYVRARQRAFA